MIVPADNEIHLSSRGGFKKFIVGWVSDDDVNFFRRGDKLAKL